MSGRLGLKGALQRQSVFDDPPCDAGTNSASLARYERQLKEMKEENSKLRNELQETRATLEMLIKQKSHESFDERRVNLLKCQLFQQERQILLLNEALGSRNSTVMEVENALSWLADNFRSYIAEEVRGACVPVPRADLVRMVETAESARIKLFKNVSNNSQENLRKPMMFMNNFLRPDLHEDFTLLDVVSGRVEHLNLKHVSKLESQLSSLYKELIRLHELMSGVGDQSADKSCPPLVSKHVAHAVRDRLDTQLLRACAMMRRCADDLLDLSLLFPSAPWPALRRPIKKDLSTDQVLASLPQLPRSKSQEVQQIVSAVLKVCSYRRHMMEREMQALREEVRFHQSVYDLQLEYVNSLLSAVRDGYSEFEKSARDVIIKPLADVLDAYQTLKDTAGEDALRDFLSAFKEHEQQFTEAVDKLNPDLDQDTEEALTLFGEDFLRALNSSVYKRQQERDMAARNRQDLREGQEKIEAELRELIGQLEEETEKLEKKQNVGTSGQMHDDSTLGDTREVDVSVNYGKDGGGRDTRRNREGSQKRAGTGEESKRDNSGATSDRNVTPGRAGSVLERRRYANTGIRHSKSDMSIGQPDPESSPEKDDSCENEKSEESLKQETSKRSDKPPSGITSKPTYKPNLIVPNRTLHLRRSGSLSRLSRASSPGERPANKMAAGPGNTSESNISETGMEDRTDNSTGRQEKSASRRKSDLPRISKLPKKAPFK